MSSVFLICHFPSIQCNLANMGREIFILSEQKYIIFYKLSFPSNDHNHIKGHLKRLDLFFLLISKSRFSAALAAPVAVVVCGARADVEY